MLRTNGLKGFLNYIKLGVTKCFVHEIIKEVVFIRFKGAKIEELLVSLCDGRHCIYGY